MLTERARGSSCATAVSICLLLLSVSPAIAALPPSTGDLSKLETRFFEHPYASETSSDRLARLEKFVFGQTRKGTDQQRLAALVGALPDDAPAEPTHSAAPAAPVAKAPSRPSSLQANAPSKPSSVQANAPKPAPSNSQNKTFRSNSGVQQAKAPRQNASRQNPPQRIASANADSAGGDVTPFTHDHMPMGPAGAGSENRAGYSPYRGEQQQYQDNSDYDAPPPARSPYGSGPAAGSSAGLEPAVSGLEMQMFGETHKQQGLNARLSAMENSMFGSSDHSGSFGQRVARLQQEMQAQSGTPVGDTTAANPPQYQRGYTSRLGSGTAMAEPPRPSNGHPLMKKAVKTAVIVGAVAGVAALTVFAAKGMSHHHHLDLD